MLELETNLHSDPTDLTTLVKLFHGCVVRNQISSLPQRVEPSSPLAEQYVLRSRHRSGA